MATITIPKNLIKNDDLVVISRKEYEDMKAQTIPTFYLKGKEAEKLDKLVEEGLREYETGETISANSLKEALKSYGKEGKKN